MTNKGKVALVITLTAPFILLFVRKPVWLRLTTGPLGGDPGILVLNPFRDRSPEREAEVFLTALRDGNQERAFEMIPNWSSATKAILSERERERKLVSWTIRDRRSTAPEKVILAYYFTDRTATGQITVGQMFLTLARSGQSWRIENYERFY